MHVLVTQPLSRTRTAVTFPASGCPKWVNRVTLAVGRPLPVYSDQRAFREKSVCRKGASGTSQVWPDMEEAAA
jgi:hypothetical protein